MNQIVDLTKTLVWPAALLFLVALFEVPILAFLNNLSKITLKAGDAEATFEAQEVQAKVGALLGAATAFRPSPEGTQYATAETPPLSPSTLTESASKLSRIVSDDTLPTFSRASILWVDDRPENNTYLIQAFKELGIHVDTPRSTNDALELLNRRQYDVIISDMGRPPDQRAGYTLLSELRKRGTFPPVVIYAGSDSEEHRKMAIDAGAIDSTNRPQRVFNTVTSIISGKAMNDAPVGHGFRSRSR
ncbi:MAG: response regulator [Candidatus Baltobacteraceae bacterium]